MKTAIWRTLAAIALAALAGQAEARSRQFYCGEESFLSLRALNATTLAAGPINGRTVALTQVPQKPMTYVYGQTAVEIAQDQKSVRLVLPGVDAVTCVWPIPDGVTTSTDGAQPQTNAPPTSMNIAANTPPAPNQPATNGDAAASAGSFPAKSWGGVVRSGPAQESRRVASLAEGEKITVIKSSGVVMNGYVWFKIRYRGNKIGYQWGGIICPIGNLVPGTFEKCD